MWISAIALFGLVSPAPATAPAAPLGPCPAPAVGSALWSVTAPSSAQDKPISLEELLKRARQAQAQAQAPLEPRIHDALAQLNETDLKASTLKSLQTDLISMGPAAGPLLVAGLDPGEGVPGPFAKRSERLAEIVAQIDDLGTVVALVQVAKTGGPAYARRALSVLRTSQHRRVIAESLLPLVDWEHPTGGTKPALETISALQGPEASLPLLAATETQKRQAICIALEALKKERNPFAGEAVLTTLKAVPDFTVLLFAADYFEAIPELISEEDRFRMPLLELSVPIQRNTGPLEPWERAANSADRAVRGADLALEVLHTPLELKSSSSLRNLLWQWHENRIGKRDRVLALLGKAGDSKAKRIYLEGSNDAVQATKRDTEAKHAAALSRRAKRFMEIGDYQNAVRDVQRALKLDAKKSVGLTLRSDLNRTGAIAQAIRGRYKEAAEHLESMGLNNQVRRQLRAMPEFAGFMESRYAEVLSD